MKKPKCRFARTPAAAPKHHGRAHAAAAPPVRSSSANRSARSARTPASACTAAMPSSDAAATRDAPARSSALQQRSRGVALRRSRHSSSSLIRPARGCRDTARAGLVLAQVALEHRLRGAAERGQVDLVHLHAGGDHRLRATRASDASHSSRMYGTDSRAQMRRSSSRSVAATARRSVRARHQQRLGRVRMLASCDQ